ncbi:MAG: DUF2007 domain-containing protein [Gammaproteobacteria bacterium]|nr:DUF2007 domain-containing protein [Gammaproteobacteria bacterium]MBU0785444.1 DUF2007 domain-containing protein [Gammaproteobacteria bacterium]MBU0813644.1 DUF2007 domain-containing protein [Gammaproteobacteria bacterium]MBU1788884.1 DUF2007 domain-containing protein [Gammaproteobacteria bacterium]
MTILANQGDMCIVVRYLSPTEAHVQCSFLQSVGIPAQVADVHLVQTHELISLAVGGASIRVPEAFLAQARQLLQAWDRGDFALGDDFDVHQAPS